jgi:hypothetical protein
MPDGAEKQKPWFKFWPSDWRGDEKLRVCSLAARGLWIECLALMHKAEPYGHLLVNGVPPTMQDLGKLIGTTTVEASRLLAELQTKGVCDVTNGGVIVSRRMVRDKAKEIRARADGGRGGNPAITNKDKPALKGGVNGSVIHAGDGRERPDSRGQKNQNQEQRAGAARRNPQPVEKSPEEQQKQLVAMALAEFESLEYDGPGDFAEHLKWKAARARLPYDGTSIGVAIDKATKIREATKARMA